MSLVVNFEVPASGETNNRVLKKNLDLLVTGINNGNNDSTVATVGDIGEYKEVITSATTTANSTVWGNIGTALSLTAGDWLVTGLFKFASSTATRCEAAVSLYSGVTTTDHVAGSNVMEAPLPTAAIDGCCTVPSYRVRVTSTSNVYLKAKATFGSGSVTCAGRISAVRIRQYAPL